MPDEVETVKSSTFTSSNIITESGMFNKVFFDFSLNILPIDNDFKSRPTFMEAFV